MRFPCAELSRPSGCFRRSEQAFTLAEVVITMCVSLLITAGIMTSQLYGMRMAQIAQVKVSARDRSVQILRLLSADVSSAHLVKIGAGGIDSFAEAGWAATQQGNALQLHPTPDTNSFIRYYWDEADARLKRVTNGANSAYVVARGVTNSTVFTAEDPFGNVLTNPQSSYVVGVALHFARLEEVEIPVGPGKYYTGYQLRTKIAPRAF